MKLTHWFRNRRLAKLSAQSDPDHRAAVAAIPSRIHAAWLAQAGEELPGWQPGQRDWEIAALALAQFFAVCASEGDAACALPSKAADSVWHVWLREDATGLVDWQQKFFGKAIPHREAAELGEPLPQALARSWVAARRSEGRLAGGPKKLPLMFAADGQLGAPSGWAYQHIAGRVSHRRIDAQGNATGRATQHDTLAFTGLAALGLLTTQELADHERMTRHSSTGSSCGSVGISTGGEGCSGTDGGGCSCGSSCGGGGCGGGS